MNKVTLGLALIVAIIALAPLLANAFGAALGHALPILAVGGGGVALVRAGLSKASG